MKKLFAVMMIACGVSACMAAPDDGKSTSAADDDESTTASALESPDETIAQCVTIQWCDAPGAIGTVCQVAKACMSQCPSTAVQNECHKEALAVCGKIVQPLETDCLTQ
jgi:hypothetical protein